MANFTQRPESNLGKTPVLDSPGIQSDFLQFIPATVTGVVNCGESIISNNNSEANMITVTKNVFSEDVNLRGVDKTKFKPLIRGFADSITIGDSVLVTYIGKNAFYLGPINTYNSPSQNFDPTLKRDTFIETVKGAVKSAVMKQGISATFPKEIFYKKLIKRFIPDLDDPNDSFSKIEHPTTGNKILSDIHTDLTLEGRHGNSIRIGSRNINPYLFISNGRIINQRTESVLDGSILSMTDTGTLNQHFPAKFIKLDETEYEFKLGDESIETPINFIKDTFQKTLGRGLGLEGEDDDDIETTIYGYNSPQLFINSDRVTINSKKDSIFLSSFRHIHLGSGDTMTFSTSNNVVFNVGAEEASYVVNAPQVKLGSQIDDETEPIVLGDTLLDLLSRLSDELTSLCTSITAITVPTTQGPSGTPINSGDFTSISSNISGIQGELESFLSIRNRTT